MMVGIHVGIAFTMWLVQKRMRLLALEGKTKGFNSGCAARLLYNKAGIRDACLMFVCHKYRPLEFEGGTKIFCGVARLLCGAGAAGNRAGGSYASMLIYWKISLWISGPDLITFKFKVRLALLSRTWVTQGGSVVY